MSSLNVLTQLLCSYFISCQSELGWTNEGTRVQRQYGEETGLGRLLGWLWNE